MTEENKFEITIKSGELFSLRSATRNLYNMVNKLETGEIEKIVLIDGENKIRAVIITPGLYSYASR